LNILTKICVVVLLILVLVASVVFINMATVPLNYRELYEASETRADLASQNARTQTLLGNRQREAINALKAQIGTLETQLADVRQKSVPDPTDLRTKELVTQLQVAKTKLTDLSGSVDAMGKRNQSLFDQLEVTRAKIGKKEEQIARLTADLSEMSGLLRRSERTVRAYQQQLRGRDERIAELEKQVRSPGAAAAEAAVTTTAKSHVVATVTAVRGERASINVGAAQGVVRGQKYYIYRNANFVGYLRVDEVDDGEAAGMVVDKQLDPVIGDKVTNDLKK